MVVDVDIDVDVDELMWMLDVGCECTFYVKSTLRAGQGREGICVRLTCFFFLKKKEGNYIWSAGSRWRI